ncbi:MAG: hypothetical protein K2J82_07115 [Muribaculaceae bacterium]|nr:hypothetical protein [Muribaculaceae bacterium]MDE6754364.1 hypothetical protein [Muribaculaceae bacterium]
MKKEKIFKPEDFDKEKKSKNKLLPWIIGGGVVCALVVGFICWSKSNDKDGSENSQSATTQVIENPIKEDSGNNDSSLTKEDVSNVSNEGNPFAGNTGDDSEVVKIKEEYTSGTTSVLNSDVEEEALKVIRGDYGNIPERKTKLGSKYQPIQNRVNQLKREGFF